MAAGGGENSRGKASLPWKMKVVEHPLHRGLGVTPHGGRVDSSRGLITIEQESK